MATGTITSLGIGSSLDLQGILDSLKKADEVSITRKQQEITDLEATRDEFNAINAKLLTMKSSALSLSLSSNFLGRDISVSSSTVMTASVAAGTDIGAYSATVNRLTSKSSFQSNGFALTTNSVNIPTTQTSDTAFADTDTTIVLEEDETMTVTYGTGDDRKIITITGETGGSTLDGVIDLINNAAENVGYVTASNSGSGTENYLQITATSGGTGEEHRVMVTAPPDSTAFSAPSKTFAYTMGDSDEISLTVTADTTLTDLAAQINDDENNPGVTATVINTGSGETPYQLKLTADENGESSRIQITGQLTDLTMTEVNGSGYTMASDNALSFSSPVIIRAADSNTDFIFKEDDGEGYGPEITATIEDGVYQTGDELAAAVENAIEAASEANGLSKDYIVTYNAGTAKLEIQEAGTLDNLAILWSHASTTVAADLGFNATDQTITPSSSSLNSSIVVDGIEYQRTSNSGITDVITGATLTLVGTGTTAINITQSTADVKESITTLITTMNDLISEIDANDDYDEDTGTWGSLAKTPSIRGAKDTLLNLMSTDISVNDNITTLYDLGFEINDDGSISIDESILDNKITSNFSDIQGFFIGSTAGTGTTGMGDLINDYIKEQTTVNGLIDSESDAVDDRITRLEEQIEFESERLDKRYETMAQQFVQLDSYMREMESMQNYVTQMFSATKKDES